MFDPTCLQPTNPNATFTPGPMVPTETLKLLAQQDHHRDRGEISPEHQTILAMYLPDIIAEALEARAEQDHLAAFGFQPGQISF